MEPFEENPAVVELGKDDVAITGFLVWCENHAIARIEPMLHAVAFNDHGKGVGVTTVSLNELVDLISKILVILGGSSSGPTDNGNAARARRRRGHHQAG